MKFLKLFKKKEVEEQISHEPIYDEEITVFDTTVNDCLINWLMKENIKTFDEGNLERFIDFGNYGIIAPGMIKVLCTTDKKNNLLGLIPVIILRHLPHENNIIVLTIISINDENIPITLTLPLYNLKVYPFPEGMDPFMFGTSVISACKKEDYKSYIGILTDDEFNAPVFKVETEEGIKGVIVHI